MTSAFSTAGPNQEFKDELDRMIDEQLCLRPAPPRSRAPSVDMDIDITINILKLDRDAVLESVRILRTAGPTDWQLPTPCQDWTVRQLVEHMAAQHRGFTAAARGESSDLAAWQPVQVGGDPLLHYRESATAVLQAFAEPGLLNREFALPEITPERTFRGSVAVGFHLLDYVVHSWDLARALGRPTRLSPRCVESALAVARLIPDAERRLSPGAPFRTSLQPAPGAVTLDLLLYATGRSPDWSAADITSSQQPLLP